MNNAGEAAKAMMRSNALLAMIALWVGAGLIPVHAQTIVYYVHTDTLGSIVAETDSVARIVSRREYEPYGQQIALGLRDGPGYTGHVQDAASGLIYMQQRYYEPSLGIFLSVDPVSANSGAGFNRYNYAAGNPYRYIDPDGRRACGKDWDCRVAQNSGNISVGRGEINAARRDPGGFLSALNERPNSQRTEGSSGRYFARSAMPVQIATGREVGADIIMMGGSARPYSVRNYVLGTETGVDQSNTYQGPGVRVAIAHTHPGNTAFSGRNGVLFQGREHGGFTVESDMRKALDANVNMYVATPNGSLLKFDLEAMRSDAYRSAESYLRANDYISELP